MAIPQFPIWSPFRRQVFRFVLLWVVLVLSTFPIPRHLVPDLGKLLLPLTTWLTLAIAQLIQLPQPYLPEIFSDSTLMYVLIAAMTLLALLGSTLWGFFEKEKSSYPRLQYGLLVIARYFVAAALFSYGFSKIFKTQFYIPEPNTLYLPMGQVPRDLLFWSLMGSSHSYSVAAGLVEVLVAALLCFRRTRLLGGVLGLLVMANIWAMNLSFDIDVKLYSGLLLLLCGIIISPDLGRIQALFQENAVVATKLWQPTFEKPRARAGYALLKTVVVCALLVDALIPHFRANSFNDDLAPRPPLHGAYQVEDFRLNGNVVTADLAHPLRWRRAFVHRKDFFIIQTMDDQFLDYKLALDPAASMLYLMPDTIPAHAIPFQIQVDNEQLREMKGVWGNDSLVVLLRTLDWRSLPLLQGEFNWRSDH